MDNKMDETTRFRAFFNPQPQGLLWARPGESSRLLDRLDQAAVRRRGLIDDLLAYAKVSAAPDHRKK